MKLRVLLPLLLSALLVVLAVAIPAGYGIANSRTQELHVQRESVMNHAVQQAALAIERGDAAPLQQYLDRLHAVHGEDALVIDASGTVIAATGELTLGEATEPLVLSALRGVPQWALPTVYPWAETPGYVAAPVSTSTSVTGAVLLRIDQSAAQSDVARWWLLLALAAVTVLALLLAASVSWTRWILRPVRSLDTAANRLAEHQLYEPTDASGPPELQRLSRSFERMARKVEEALEQQRGLVADASHQLRTPLAAIRLRIDSLPGALDSPEIAEVQHDLDRLEYTVNRMLTLAQAEHRANENDRAVLVAGDSRPPLVTTSGEMLVAPHRRVLAEAKIEIQTFGGTLELLCQSDDLEEIVGILADNARKYVPAGSTLRVGFEREGSQAVLVVADNGPGLDADDLSRIGTRFWRSSRHSASPGTGLGHAIVVELARANGGTAQIDAAPGGGLRTRVRLASA